MSDAYHQQQNARATIELCEPAAPMAEHNHVITPPEWSLAPQKRRWTGDAGDSHPKAVRANWPIFWNKHRDSLSSLSTTTEEPLIRSSTSEESLSYQTITSESHLPFADQYGCCLEILHYGFNSTVRLHQGKDTVYRPNNAQLFAVKAYRRNIWGFLGLPVDNRTSCSPAAIADFHPQHPNIIPITDLLFNKQSQLCLVTPYCEGGNLHKLLMSKQSLPTAEIDCLIAQILRALAFLHEQNMAHRDVRLETVLLTQNGAVKLAGFSDEYVHRIWAECAISTESDSGEEDAPDHHDDPSSSSSHSPPSTWSFSSILSKFYRPCISPIRAGQPGASRPSASFPGIRLPYMAPENFLSGLHRWYHDDLQPEPDNRDEDPRPADIWATGIVYLTLITGRLPWHSARRAPQDPKYNSYLRCRPGDGNDYKDGYPPIEAIGEVRRFLTEILFGIF
ncbi:kinase-like domain-containing protein [Aspergillus granulosus]|uniref:Kinase-like domain-containing protein n=1 Tax=Aspergillus granulosus TaxID=176169 RepID=A0ABR4H1P1_9EURO